MVSLGVRADRIDDFNYLTEADLTKGAAQLAGMSTVAARRLLAHVAEATKARSGWRKREGGDGARASARSSRGVGVWSPSR